MMLPHRWPRATWLSLAMALGAAPLAAQVDEQVWRWVDAQGGFCIWYLADPAIAPTLVPAGTTLRPASATPSLPEALLRIVQDEPRFAEWIPGVVCIGVFAAVSADGRPVATMRPGGTPMLLTLSGLAAASPYGQDAGWQLTGVGARAGALDRTGEAGWIAVRDPELRIRSGLEGEDDQWEVTLEGVKLAWSGHSTGEPRVGSTRSMSFGYAGNRNSMWLVEFRSSPAEEQNQVGALRVEGRQPLAQALKSSPIRAVGALGRGGDLTLTFRRLAPVPR